MVARRYCSFHLGEFCFGIPVELVQEVLRRQPETLVPLAPPAVRGLINLRGQIIPAVDLRHRLQFADRSEPRGMNVIVTTDSVGTVSFVVDSVGDILDVGETDFEPAPDTMSQDACTLVQGAYKLEDRLLLILDAEALVELG